MEERAPEPRPSKAGSVAEVLRHYPRLVGHLICQSLGYFTPKSAALAVLAHTEGKPFCCEWYAHLFGFADAPLIEGNRRILKAAIRDRRRHHGYMVDFETARLLVAAELQGEGPVLASWF